ncbi:MAG: bifunctional phosphopantothenoylcysteine decarboxylase/phosphopantothenate--cysteine ligase CoaBC [Lachnospiraceae bacterium]
MLKGKTVVLGVTGSIAAYKIASLASMLVKLQADVHVIMTEHATEFITPVTFETLTKNKCLVDTFDRNFQFHVAHVSLGQKADVVLVAPATANIIGKLAHGIADDMLSTTLMATTAPIIVSPAMNMHMYENPILQANLEQLRSFGIQVIEPATGFLACRDIGPGKMPEPETLLSYILKEIAFKKDLIGKKVVVTAGPTQEALDPVRFLSNHSTGKMGYELGKAAMLRGAEVTLITGPTALLPPPFMTVVSVESAKEMYEAVMKQAEDAQIIIMAAAVADYCPIDVSSQKMKKQEGEISIALSRTKDILAQLGERKTKDQFICGFSMETENLVENSQKKLNQKRADLIVANSLRQEGAGFGTDTNVVTLITKESVEELPIMGKDQVAHCILDKIVIAN